MQKLLYEIKQKMAKRDYYEVLGVSKNANEKDIKNC